MTVATTLQIHEKKNSSSKLVRRCKVSASLTNVDTDTGESTHTHTCMQRLTGSETTELTFVPVPGEKMSIYHAQRNIT